MDGGERLGLLLQARREHVELSNLPEHAAEPGKLSAERWWMSRYEVVIRRFGGSQQRIESTAPSWTPWSSVR